MEINKKIKLYVRRVLKYTPFSITSIGPYIRGLYWEKYLQKIPIEEFEKVLDAGCGTGDYARKLAIKYPHLIVNAYDIKVYETWDDKPNNVFFKQKNLLDLKEYSFYDLCYSIDVLEHISKNYKVMFNLYRALKAGGYLFLHIPNKLQRRILSKKFFIEHESWGKKEHIGEMYSVRELRKILIAVGFEIIASRETFGFFGRLAWEIDIIVHKKIILKILVMPFLKILSYLDLFFELEEGNGMIIIAKK